MKSWRKAILSLIVSGLVIASALNPGAASAQQADATSYGDGLYYSSENQVPLAKPLWTTEVGKRKAEGDMLPQIVSSSDTVLYIKDGILVARNVKTGKVVWTYGSKLREGTVVASATSVYVSGINGTVYRIDMKSGKGKAIYQWSNKTDKAANGLISSLSLQGGTLYASSSAGLISIDPVTGKENWRADAIMNAGASMQLINHTLIVSVIESGAITVNAIYGYDAATGKQLWHLSGSHSNALEIEGDTAYFLDDWPKNDSSKYRVDIDIVNLKTGEIMGTKSFVPIEEGEDALQSARKVIMIGHDLYIDVEGKGIYHYNIDADTAVVKPQIMYDEGKWIAGPYNGKLFFTDSNNQGIHGRKVADQSRVYYDGPNNPISRLDLIGNGLYIGQTDGQVYAMDVTTGKAVFRYDTSARSFGPFHVSGSTLLVLGEGKLYAFEIPKSLQADSSQGTPSGTLSKADAKLSLNGEERAFKPSMMTMDNRMFVPLRFLSEALGAQVKYNNQSKESSITYNGRSFTIKEGISYATISGKQSALSLAPISDSGNLYVPIKDIGGLLGVKVEWDGAKRTVVVTTNLDMK